jgi:hypothetical protein
MNPNCTQYGPCLDLFGPAFKCTPERNQLTESFAVSTEAVPEAGHDYCSSDPVLT